MTAEVFLNQIKDDLHKGDFFDLIPEIVLWLTEVTGKDRSFFHMNGKADLNEIVTREEKNRFLEILDRRKKREPLAYILGNCDFYGRTFVVGEGVLIPRPDTEILIETLLSQPEMLEKEEVFFYDLCTGSGCLGITTYLERKKRGLQTGGCLTDISPCALTYANKNIQKWNAGAALTAIEADLVPSGTLLEPADFIISNPPYIPDGDIPDLMPDVVCYEPREALSGGAKGLDFYLRIVNAAERLLKKRGLLLVEHGYDQAQKVTNIFRHAGFSDVKTIKDYGDHPRITLGRKGL